jgi:hypothetical protein
VHCIALDNFVAATPFEQSLSTVIFEVNDVFFSGGRMHRESAVMPSTAKVLIMHHLLIIQLHLPPFGDKSVTMQRHSRRSTDLLANKAYRI